MTLQENRTNANDTEQRKAHYGSGEQPWDIIKRLGWGAQFAAANVLKYLRRTKDPEHSLESARWYYARIQEMVAADNSIDAYFAWMDLHNELTPEEVVKLQ